MFAAAERERERRRARWAVVRRISRCGRAKRRRISGCSSSFVLSVSLRPGSRPAVLTGLHSAFFKWMCAHSSEPEVLPRSSAVPLLSLEFSLRPDSCFRLQRWSSTAEHQLFLTTSCSVPDPPCSAFARHTTRRGHPFAFAIPIGAYTHARSSGALNEANLPA